MRRIYLDNNATSPVDERVLQAMLPYFGREYGNASSIHTAGQTARSAVERARSQVAELIGARSKEVVFTAGGTEADNTAVLGVAERHRERGEHVVTTSIEHPAVLASGRELERRGFRVTTLPVDSGGMIRVGDLEAALDAKTVLVSVIHGNNEIGALQPLPEITALAREKEVLVHTDAVQTVGKIPVDVSELGVDLLSISAHKLHGPKGVGALWVRAGVDLDPLLVGGSHERSRRAGTLNVPGIVGMGEACALAAAALEDLATRVAGLRDRLERGILEIPDTWVNGTTTARLPHTANIGFKDVEGEALMIALDFEGVAVSTGSACSSGSLEPSHVLRALGRGDGRKDAAIRFSLSRMNTEEEIDQVLEMLPGIVKRMREVSPLYRAT